YFKFADAITNNKTIHIYNKGQLYRDFTYIDDIVKSIDIISEKFNNENINTPYSEIFNIGGGQKVNLNDFINYLETAIGKIGRKKYVEMQKGDVFETNADTKKLLSYINLKPEVTIKEGLEYFVNWYKAYSK
ncbi:MAG: hypothetical protein U9Q83_04360, partial [Bacteroidota bacterium]|nr:hypothetical protein [Bacteroidota bacterium]